MHDPQRQLEPPQINQQSGPVTLAARGAAGSAAALKPTNCKPHTQRPRSSASATSNVALHCCINLTLSSRCAQMHRRVCLSACVAPSSPCCFSIPAARILRAGGQALTPQFASPYTPTHSHPSQLAATAVLSRFTRIRRAANCRVRIAPPTVAQSVRTPLHARASADECRISLQRRAWRLQSHRASNRHRPNADGRPSVRRRMQWTTRLADGCLWLHPQKPCVATASAVRRLCPPLSLLPNCAPHTPPVAAELHWAQAANGGSPMCPAFTHAPVVAAPAASTRPWTPRRHQTPTPAADPAARRAVSGGVWGAMAGPRPYLLHLRDRRRTRRQRKRHRDVN
jgi:hypothetical protein